MGKTGLTFLKGHALVALLLIVVAVALVAAVAQPAAAFLSYEHGGIIDCATCHTVNTSTPPTNAQCTGCHTSFTAKFAAPKDTCWSCHTPGQSTVSTFKTPAGCASGAKGATCHNSTAAPHVGSTSAGCTSCHGTTVNSTNSGTSVHHVAVVTAKPVLTIKVAPTSIKLKKTVKASGLYFQGATSVKILVQMKNAKGKWVKVTTKTAKVSTSHAWTLTYKPGKKGSYRLQTSSAAAGSVTAGKTAFKTFKVK
jgi:hypothetical protein